MIELLLPAGNLEKAKFALIYGADAIYIGAKKFSLRAQASNFELADIKEICDFAHKLNKKVYVTVNAVVLEDEINDLGNYLIDLEKTGIDGIIVSDPSVLMTAKEKTKLHISLSTQASSINYRSVNYYKDLGINRVVLGRELSIDEIRNIKNNTTLELEVFVHGGMCSNYSGRCTLSNYMVNRDANRGGCAHSCRWNYYLYDNGKLIDDKYFQMGSNDLAGIPYIEDLINIGVDSLKVEGRMKSLNYVSTVAYTYRMLIDDILNGNKKNNSYYMDLLESSENRESYTGFLSGVIDSKLNLYQEESKKANQAFLGVVKEFDKDNMEATIEVRNYFNKSDIFEVMSPGLDLFNLNIESIINKDSESIDEATHALEILKIKVNKELKPYDIIRRKL